MKVATLVTCSLMIAGVVMTAILFGDSSKTMEPTTRHDYTYAVCMDAHQHVGGVTESRCEQAEDQTKTEFLCTTNDPVARCWVEVK